ncbi:2798_t:CDS:2, partial [Scutellospora calospora]
NIDSLLATTRVISSKTYNQETDCVEISKRVWQSNKINKYISQDYALQDSYSGYKTDEYRLELNSEEETPPDPFYNYDLKAASGMRNAFDLIYICEKKNTRIFEHDETNLVDINNKRVLYKCQKVNMQDESVGQSSNTFKSSKVSKFGRSLLRSPVWKWFEEIYVDNTQHDQYNVEIADKKLCDTKYSEKTEQQTTITKVFEASLLKPYSITEQTIHDRAIIETVPSRRKIKSLIDEEFEQICSHLRDDLYKAETVSLTADLWIVHSCNSYLGITIMWINKMFKLNEAILAVTSLKYSHTTDAIAKYIEDLKPYIKILASSLTVQQEKDAIANRKCLKAIMITEDEWSIVANIIKILKPFNDITNYISGSSYLTMSIIYLMMSTLWNTLLKKFENEDINDNFIDEQIEINTSLFDDEEELNEDAEQFKSP